MPKTAEPRKNTVRLAPVSVREAKMRRGISGDSASRPSMTRKTAMSASPAAIGPSVWTEFQP